LLDKQVNSHIR